ncbi:MAG: CPBP family intramembrane metalloprotease [Chloroflexi bacterium]|nr:CPBP family intramembrane metalloprotease [Chloroflexota bacterium]
MNSFIIFSGFLILFLLYQLAEANGQDILNIPGKPYSILLMFLLVLPAAALVARWQDGVGLSAYGMGLLDGWWKNYLFGVGLGLTAQSILEWIGIQLGVRRGARFRFSWRTLCSGLLWTLVTNFPAATGEDILTRGYLWRFMQSSPLLAFVLVSAAVYTLNHVIRLLTRPITDWYHLPFLGLTLAYALYQTGSLWFVIGLHQSGNVIVSLMRQMMDVTNTVNIKKRIIFGVLSEITMLVIIALAMPLMMNFP